MRKLSIFVILLLLTTSVLPASAAEKRCVGTNTTVYAESANDIRLACAGAADAASFLSQLGLTVDTVMRVDVLDVISVQIWENSSFRVLGEFDAKQNRIKVTSTDGQREMAKEKPIFGIPYDEAFFRGVVAHEVAHAIADDNFQVAEPSRMAHEYIAYVVQLATMPARSRQQVLDHYQATAFSTELEINPMIYGLNPDVFAVKSYLHFLKPDTGIAFVQRLLHRDLMSIFSFPM